jgi:hypothetical protein
MCLSHVSVMQTCVNAHLLNPCPRHACVSLSTNSYAELSWYHFLFQAKHEKLVNFHFLLLDLNSIDFLWTHFKNIIMDCCRVPSLGDRRVPIIYAPTRAQNHWPLTTLLHVLCNVHSERSHTCSSWVDIFESALWLFPFVFLSCILGNNSTKHIMWKFSFSFVSGNSCWGAQIPMATMYM